MCGRGRGCGNISSVEVDGKEVDDRGGLLSASLSSCMSRHFWQTREIFPIYVLHYKYDSRETARLLYVCVCVYLLI